MAVRRIVTPAKGIAGLISNFFWKKSFSLARDAGGAVRARPARRGCPLASAYQARRLAHACMIASRHDPEPPRVVIGFAHDLETPPCPLYPTPGPRDSNRVPRLLAAAGGTGRPRTTASPRPAGTTGTILWPSLTVTGRRAATVS